MAIHFLGMSVTLILYGSISRKLNLKPAFLYPYLGQMKYIYIKTFMLSKASMVKYACQLETVQVHMLRSNSPHGTNLEPGFIARGSYTIVNFIVAKKTYCRLYCDFCSAVFIGRLYNDNRSHDIPKTLRFFFYKY